MKPKFFLAMLLVPFAGCVSSGAGHGQPQIGIFTDVRRLRTRRRSAVYEHQRDRAPDRDQRTNLGPVCSAISKAQ